MNADGFAAEVVVVNGHTTVRARGELDLATRAAFDSAVDEAVALDRHVLVDLRGVTFLGSTGLSVLIRAHRAVQARGHRLTVLLDAPIQRQLLAATGLDGVLHVIGAEESV